MNLDRIPHCERKTDWSRSVPSSYGGLTPSQFELLASLHHHGDRELVFLVMGQGKRTVDALIGNGFAASERRADPDAFDFITKYLVITESGRNALVKAWKAYDRYEAKQTREREEFQREEDRKRKVYEASRWFLYFESVDDFNRQHTYKGSAYVWRFIRIDGEHVPHIAREQAEHAADWPKKAEGDRAWWSWNLKGIVASSDAEASALAKRVLGDRFHGRMK